MQWYHISTLITGVANLLLALLVYAKNRTQRPNQCLALLSTGIFLWCILAFRVEIAAKIQEALFWDRLTYIGILWTTTAFVTLHLYMANVQNKRKILIPFYLISLSFLFISFHPLFIKGETTTLSPFVRYSLIPGPLYLVFVLYWIGYVIYAHIRLFQHYKSTTGARKNQIKYLFLATVVAGIGAIFYFLLVSNIPVPPIDNFFVIAFPSIIAYAIIKHHLMDITVVIKKSIIYSSLVGAISACYASSIIAFERIFQMFAGHQLSETTRIIIPGTVTALAVVIGLQPLKEKLQYLVDKLFFKNRYDYHKTLLAFSEEMTSMLELDKLSQSLVNMVVNTMHVSHGLLQLKNEAGEFNTRYTATHKGFEYNGMCVTENSPIIKWLEAHNDILVSDEVESSIQSVEGSAIKSDLERISGSLAISLKSRKSLIGIFVIGHKLSGDMYSTEDLELLSTLANQSAIAIENALLYNTVLEIKNYNENILQNLSSGVIAINTEGKISIFNESASKLTGLKGEDIVGKDAIVLGNDFDHLLMATLVEGKRYNNYEMSIVSMDGRTIPIGLSTSTLKNVESDTIGTIMVFTDLSELKELEAEMRRADRLASIGTLAAGMAHEIKNPLVSIKTFAQLLPEKFQDTEFRDKFSHIATAEVDRITHLINQLLTFSRPSKPNFRLENVNSIIEEVTLSVEAKAEEKSIKINHALQKDLPDILIDKEKIRQVFFNIILNAIEAMSDEGKIVINTSLAKSRRRYLGTANDFKSFLQINISDNGPGIPDENIDKLFNPFFTTKHEGTGLGLAIVHRIIDEHHGLIQICSEIGKGTTFIISLPVANIGHTMQGETI